MTEYELSQYRAISAEIKDLDRRIEDTKKAEITLFGTVKGSSKYFPYTPQHFKVAGVDPAESERRHKKINKLLDQREQKRTELISIQIQIEEYISGIEDSLTRTIFRKLYFDGETQMQIARELGYDQSRISRKVSNYINTHKKHKIMC